MNFRKEEKEEVKIETVDGLTIADINNFFPPSADCKIDLNASYFAELVRKNPGLSRADFLSHLHKCLLTGADPRIDQIYLITYKNKDGSITASSVFSYHYFIARAQQTGELDGFECKSKPEKYYSLKEGEVNSYTSQATVWRKGWSHPVVYQARFWEFAKTFYSDGEKKLSGQWATKPILMLEKSALCNAIRQAFPAQMSGMYTAEEIQDHRHAVKTESQIFDDKKPKAIVVSPVVASVATEKERAEEPLSLDDAKLAIKNTLTGITDDLKNHSKLTKMYSLLGVKNFAEIHNSTDVDYVNELKFKLDDFLLSDDQKSVDAYQSELKLSESTGGKYIKSSKKTE